MSKKPTPKLSLVQLLIVFRLSATCFQILDLTKTATVVPPLKDHAKFLRYETRWLGVSSKQWLRKLVRQEMIQIRATNNTNHKFLILLCRHVIETSWGHHWGCFECPDNLRSRAKKFAGLLSLAKWQEWWCNFWSLQGRVWWLLVALKGWWAYIVPSCLENLVRTEGTPLNRGSVWNCGNFGHHFTNDNWKFQLVTESCMASCQTPFVKI